MRMKMTYRQIERQLNQWNVKAESVKRESTTVTGFKIFWKNNILKAYIYYMNQIKQNLFF